MEYKLKNGKKQCWRHGEVIGVLVDKLPEDLIPSKEKVFMVGYHGNNHSIDNGTLYFKKESDFIFGYLEAKDTHLIHPEHSPKIGDAKIEDRYYQLIKQVEYTPDGLVPVVD